MLTITWIPLAYGTVMAIFDVMMLSSVKMISLHQAQLLKWMIVPTLIYAVQPWIFLKSLQFETLIVMNLLWDLMSNILVTIVGFLYFKERLGPYKTIGVILSFISVIFLSIEDGKWEDFLSLN